MNITEQINCLDRNTARHLKAIIETSFEALRVIVSDEKEAEEIYVVLESIVWVTKKRIKELSIDEESN